MMKMSFRLRKRVFLAHSSLYRRCYSPTIDPTLWLVVSSAFERRAAVAVVAIAALRPSLVFRDRSSIVFDAKD